MMFKDRREAGKMLAERLGHYKGRDVIVLAIPRGGVVVGGVIAEELEAPLDIIIARKIGAPGNPEYAVGAVSPDGTTFIDREAVDFLGISDEYLEEEKKRQMVEIERRAVRYRSGSEYALKGKVAILVDDGVATGYTAMAALEFARKRAPSRLIFAVPVGPPATLRRLREMADEVVCLDTPLGFHAISQFYRDFEQVSDEEVKLILRGRK